MSITIGDLSISDNELAALGLASPNSTTPGTPLTLSIGKPGLTQELIALSVLVLTGLLLPEPFGIRFAILILAGYMLIHPNIINSIVGYLNSGLTTIEGL